MQTDGRFIRDKAVRNVTIKETKHCRWIYRFPFLWEVDLFEEWVLKSVRQIHNMSPKWSGVLATKCTGIKRCSPAHRHHWTTVDKRIHAAICTRGEIVTKHDFLSEILSNLHIINFLLTRFYLHKTKKIVEEISSHSNWKTFDYFYILVLNLYFSYVHILIKLLYTYIN